MIMVNFHALIKLKVRDQEKKENTNIGIVTNVVLTTLALSCSRVPSLQGRIYYLLCEVKDSEFIKFYQTYL